MQYRKLIITTALAASLTGAAFVIVPSVSAQGPQQGQNMPVRAEVFQACSTTDYTEVAAKALGMTATELRAALAGGKSLEAVAQTKQVDYQTVTDALKAAETADIDQAVKDGLLTQAEADALKQALSNTPQTMPSQNGTQGGVPGQDGTQGVQPGQNGAQGGQLGMPNDMQPGMMGRSLGRADGVSARNQVKAVAVAADALGLTCVDLAKALQSGKSIATVAGEKNVAIQTVSDALVKAYQAALDKDVQEGLIAKVQADTESAQLLNRALAEIAGNGGRDGRGAPGMPPMNGSTGAGK